MARCVAALCCGSREIRKLLLLDRAGRYQGIEGLRGLAVLLVFFVHFGAVHYHAEYYVDPESWAHQIFLALDAGPHRRGHLLVLSRFLIYVTTSRTEESASLFLGTMLPPAALGLGAVPK